MRTTFASLALAAMAAANPMPQAVTSAISPSASAPSGCQTSYSGTFEVEINNVTMSKRSLEEKRDGTALTLSLNNGVLKDAQGRTGYIAANRQFQFDGPPQAGAIYTAGWSLCSNGSLTIGANSIFYECLSGNFYNLYDVSQGKQCAPIYIVKLGNTAGAASQGSDGQITASPVPVTQLTDGQPQGTTAAPVTQLSDGQPQATTGRPVTQISDGQIQATTGHPVTQISDGQIQATTGHPVTQISDGQIQATVTPARSTGSPVTQLSDGQPQAPSGKPTMKTNTTMMATGSMTPTQTAAAAYTGAAIANAVGTGFFGLAAVFAVALL